ncbi:MAG: hypothetical protein ACO37W_15640 [Prochlorotrichaceae cyanobacterium]
MWDKSVPSITIKLYPLTLAGVILLSSLSLGSWGLWWFQVYPPGWRTDSTTSTDLEPPFSVPDPVVSSDPLVWSGSAADLDRDPQPTVDSLGNAVPDTSPLEMSAFRVGNQTPHPVRIALLQRFRVGETGSEAQAEFNPALPNTMANFPVTDLKEPVHWDFEPGEGSYQGLILSLPEGDLALNPGDVLVAFAQDGSRRYWGPYVVGETSLPYWNEARSEWQLLLQP